MKVMKKLFLCLALILVNVLAFAQTSVNLENVEVPAKLTDRTERIIVHKGYIVSYNADWKIPNWVAYELTDTEVAGEEPRAKKFVPDPMVPKYESATTDDYKNSGWDRGHMAPAADMKWHPQAMKESFYLSNVCPQNITLTVACGKTLRNRFVTLQCLKVASMWCADLSFLLIIKQLAQTKWRFQAHFSRCFCKRMMVRYIP